jgi:hypothetical protein
MRVAEVAFRVRVKTDAPGEDHHGNEKRGPEHPMAVGVSGSWCTSALRGD